MAGSVATGHALSRGLKISSSRSVCSLPFLYQTSTLRRYYSELQNLAKENQERNTQETTRKSEPSKSKASRPSRPSREDYVPFERPAGSEPSIMSRVSEGMTVTNTERRAFQQLESLSANQANRTRKREVAESFDNLDDVVNEAIRINEYTERGERLRRDLEAMPDETRETAMGGFSDATKYHLQNRKPRHHFLGYHLQEDQSGQISVVENEPEEEHIDRPTKKKLGWVAEKNAYKRSQVMTREWVSMDKSGLTFINIRTAQTDTDVWNLAERVLFIPIAALDLDSGGDADPKTIEQRQELMKLFPKRMNTMAAILRIDFPGSNLILSLIPKLRSLGPAAYALGVTTKLYNQIMAFHFEKYADIDSVNSLLEEMEREVIEPDEKTLELINFMLKYQQSAQQGVHGRALRAIWATERFKRSFAVLARWKVRVEQSVQLQEIRAAKFSHREGMQVIEGEAGRKTVRYYDVKPRLPGASDEGDATSLAE